jgi:hypothetical protein
VALLFTGAFARAQYIFQFDWGESFNNSATGNDAEDSWVANSYTIANANQTNIVSISLPFADTFTNQPISGFIYQGFDLNDPTANGGLVLKARKDTTFSSVPGTILTIALDTPVTFNVGDIMYVAVLIPGVPGSKFPFQLDIGVGSGFGGLLMTQFLGRSFFDVGMTPSGAWDVNQGSGNITPMGGTHPVVGPGIQDAGNLALWAQAATTVSPLLSAGTTDHATQFFQMDWGEVFNTNMGTETEDNWVGQSYRINGADRTRIMSISLPIADTFSNQPISGLIYMGSDVLDPKAGGGLVLMARKDTTFSSTPGTVVTITLDTPVDFSYDPNASTLQVMYVAVLIPGVTPDKFPFFLDNGSGSGLGGSVQTQPLNRSFFDVGTTAGGAWDPNQGSANITVLGGTHPVVGKVQDAGNIALWAFGTTPQ